MDCKRDRIVPINEDLSIVYSQWANGSVFRRATPLWSGLRLLPYVAPSANATVAALAARGVAWVLAEHVSITVRGSVRYLYDTADGTVEDFGTAGCHNVEHGGGYLPAHAFTRWCDDDHISCCVMRKPNRAAAARYAFSIAEAPDPAAAFSHAVEGLSDRFIIGRLRSDR